MKTQTQGSYRFNQLNSPYSNRRLMTRKTSDQSIFNQFRQQFDVETLFKEVQEKKEIINQLQQEVQMLRTKIISQESQLKNYENTILDNEKTKAFDRFLADGDCEGSLKSLVISLKRTVREKERQVIKLFDELQAMRRGAKAIKMQEQEKTLIFQSQHINDLMFLIEQRDKQILLLQNDLKQSAPLHRLDEIKIEVAKEQDVLESLKKQQEEVRKQIQMLQEQQVPEEQTINWKKTRERRYQSQESIQKKQSEDIKITRKTSSTEDPKLKTEQTDFLAFKQDLIAQQQIQKENQQIVTLKNEIEQLFSTIKSQQSLFDNLMNEKQELDKKNLEQTKEIIDLKDQRSIQEHLILDLQIEIQELKQKDQNIKLLVTSQHNPKGIQLIMRYGQSLNDLFEQIKDNNWVVDKTVLFIPSKNMRYAHTQWNTRFSDFTSPMDVESTIMIIELQKIQ